MKTSAWTLEKDQDGICFLTFDLPGEKINKFTLESLKELDEILDRVKGAQALVIISGKPGTFIAGADLKMFEEIMGRSQEIKRILEEGHRIFNRVAHLGCPSIAVIDGTCLGGGTELALACTHRIVTDGSKVEIGLPEVQLGIVPGWGGTQRLPKLVGLQNSLPIILGGSKIDGKKAWKIGFADLLISSEFLREELPVAIEKILSKRAKRNKPSGALHWLLEENPIGRALIYSQAKKGILKKTKGQYPAPLIALDLIERTYGGDLDKGLATEKAVFVENAEGPFAITPNLIRVFFGMERLKKQETPHALPVESVGVIGAGVMGSGIGWLASYYGKDVRIKDINWEVLGKGIKEINGIYQELKKIRKVTRDEIRNGMHRVSYGINDSGFATQDLVVEAATENLELKKKIFSDLEKRLRADAFIATNTSSLKMSDMEGAFKHPERFVGLHFFNPVNRMPLVEVVRGAKTSDEAVDSAVRFCLDCKKIPIVVKDCAGFVVNRVFAAQANEVMHLVEEGVSMERLEKLLTKFGFPMGPFELADTVGNDVGAKVFKIMENAYGARMKCPQLIPLMAEKGLIGKKGGKGFYLYKGKEKKVNPEALELLKSVQKGRGRSYTDEEIIDQILFVMISEAAHILEEGIVEDPKDLDMAMILGTGFPPFRGGLLQYANERGIPQVVETLQKWEKTEGIRFAPCALLVNLARADKKFDV